MAQGTSQNQNKSGQTRTQQPGRSSQQNQNQSSQTRGGNASPSSPNSGSRSGSTASRTSEQQVGADEEDEGRADPRVNTVDPRAI